MVNYCIKGREKKNWLLSHSRDRIKCGRHSTYVVEVFATKRTHIMVLNEVERFVKTVKTELWHIVPTKHLPRWALQKENHKRNTYSLTLTGLCFIFMASRVAYYVAIYSVFSWSRTFFFFEIKNRVFYVVFGRWEAGVRGEKKKLKSEHGWEEEEDGEENVKLTRQPLMRHTFVRMKQ